MSFSALCYSSRKRRINAEDIKKEIVWTNLTHFGLSISTLKKKTATNDRNTELKCIFVVTVKYLGGKGFCFSFSK